MLRDKNGDPNIEFYNYWTNRAMMEDGIVWFRVGWVDAAFVGARVLQIILLNFELRIYINQLY